MNHTRSSSSRSSCSATSTLHENNFEHSFFHRHLNQGEENGYDDDDDSVLVALVREEGWSEKTKEMYGTGEQDDEQLQQQQSEITDTRSWKHRAVIMIIVVVIVLAVMIVVLAVTLSRSSKEDEENRDTNPFTFSPTSTQSTPTLTPITVFEPFVMEWAKSSLPDFTLQTILSNQDNSNDSILDNDSSSPQAKALLWAQTDPYFTSLLPLSIATSNNGTGTTTAYSSNNNTDDNDNPTIMISRGGIMDENMKTIETSGTDIQQQRQRQEIKRLIRYGLATLYFATNGEEWSLPLLNNVTTNMTTNTTTNSTSSEPIMGWLSPHDECSWPLVECHYNNRDDIGERRRNNSTINTTIISTTPHIHLQLANLTKLVGSLPAELVLLSSSLQRLQLFPKIDIVTNTTNNNNTNNRNNNVGLTGTLPTELGLLTHLRQLDLRNNQLEGTIVTELGLLSNNLQAVYLQSNRFDTNSSVPLELCRLLESSSNFSLTTLVVDCPLIVQCNCDCQCASAGEMDTNGRDNFDNITSNSNSEHNIFDHDNNTNISITALPTPPTMIPVASPAVPVTVIPSSEPSIYDDSPPQTQPTALLCNGLANTCEQQLPNVLFPMVHNAMATKKDKFFLYNHLEPLEVALVAGYRGINLDICRCKDNNGGDEKLVFCHDLCLLGTRDIAEVFQNLLQFLVSNPHEVLQISLQMSNDRVNSDQEAIIDLIEFYSILKDVGKELIDMIYVHNSTVEEWPTLRNLIEANQRLVLYHYNGPTCDNDDEVSSSCPLGLHYYFDYVAETEFSFDSVADLQETESSCRITRGSTGKHRAFLGVNNFIKLPSLNKAPELNSFDFLSQRVQDCVAHNKGWAVSFLYVDFWSVGNVLEYVQEYNRELG